jgi:tyrosyl-tRNA synthetase
MRSGPALELEMKPSHSDLAVLDGATPKSESLSMSAASPFKSEFLRTLEARGYIHQITHPDELDNAASTGVVTAYVGFDATASSLHVGNLISIMMLRRLQQTGHKPIVLMGGGTTKVGDPSGKDESRKMLTEDGIKANIASIKRAFEKFLTFGDGPTDAIMVGQLRLDREQPLTVLEFNYMLMQATDFLELNRKRACVLQMGGSDQWGNILNGVELIRRVDQKPAFGLTTPLLTTSSGAKMGKTAAGAVWLNADVLSPYEYWQFWRNTEDADVGRFLKLFTDLPLERIAELEALEGAQINDAKKVLADEATRLAHGEDEARKARDAAEKAFEQGALSADLPTFEVPAAELEAGIVLAALFTDAGLAASRGEARRLAQGGGVKVNDKAEADANRTITSADLVEGVVKLAAGKKKIVLVKPV